MHEYSDKQGASTYTAAQTARTIYYCFDEYFVIVLLKVTYCWFSFVLELVYCSVISTIMRILQLLNAR